MKDISPISGGYLVHADDAGALVTTSLVIAEQTGNQHKNIIALVRENLDDLNDVGRVAFQTRPLETAGGRQHREVATLDEPAAALLMTYLRNTPKVKDFKRELVREFYAMREMLTGVAPQSPAELILAQAQALVAHEHRLAAVETRQAELAKRLDAVAPDTGDELFYSGRGWARIRGAEIGLRRMIRLGAKAGVIGRAAGLEPDRIADPRWGLVNGWPLWVWDAAHDQVENGSAA